MKVKKMLNKVNVWKKNSLYSVNSVADVGENESYEKAEDFRDIIIMKKIKIRENNKQKSHENLGIFPKMKKSVAFFQANPWLENSHKITENQYKIIKNSYKIEDLEI
jgi:hypothetical protein